MKVEDIIEGLNKYIELKREDANIKTTGHVVLQKEIIPHASFKIYKTCKYILWFIKDKKSYKIMSVNYTGKIPNGQEESIVIKMSILLITRIFEWIGSKSYNEVIKGEYNGISENVNE